MQSPELPNKIAFYNLTGREAMLATNQTLCTGGEKCISKLHLCRIVKDRRDPKLVRDVIGEPKFYCRKCGRTAMDSHRLCNPALL